MAELYSIHFSPWSLKAKWALAHYDSPHTNKEFLSGVTNALVRVKTKNLCGRLTVPVLIDKGGHVLGQSLEIARWASLHKGPNHRDQDLFPGMEQEAIEQWNARSDEILNYARILAMQSMLANEAALKQTMPKIFRNPIGCAVARRTIRKLLKKYEDEPGSNSIESGRVSLVALQDTLAKNGGQYILRSFSYADITMVIALLSVCSPGDIMPTGTDLQKGFLIPGFATEFPDLVDWGRKVYSKHIPDGKESSQ